MKKTVSGKYNKVLQAEYVVTKLPALHSVTRKEIRKRTKEKARKKTPVFKSSTV